MAARCVLWWFLGTLLRVLGEETSVCSFSCPSCPANPSCPAPTCPTPQCPPLPNIPSCPIIQCPTLPEVPSCPTPVYHLSCPNVTCPPQSCPSCPACPNAPSCPCSPPPATRTFPPGYELKSHFGAYKIYGITKSWRAANATCATDGAYLAFPKSNEEDTMLRDFVRGLTGRAAIHVGFYRTSTYLPYRTVLDGDMSGIQRRMWATGYPRIYHGCAYISSLSNYLFSEDCTDNEKFVCEIPLRSS